MNRIKKLLSFAISLALSFTVVHADAPAPDDASKQPISYQVIKSHNNNLSFYFQNIDIRALLQLIAQNSGMNFVINDLVKGNVTLHLQDVTWQQALDIILKSNGLAARHTGNVMYISTLDNITANETKRLQSEQAIANLAPLQSTIVHLKYASATDVATLLKGSQSNLLTTRGEVAVDSRTNSLIIRDISTNLTTVQRDIRVLDIPARQVLIEARIVNIDSTYEEQLGVRFGISNSRHLSGTFNGANEINSGISPSQVTDPTQRLNFNIPARQLFDGNTPGSVAIALAHLGPALLDLELSALEGENHAKVVARPRVITSNQKKAVILTGQEIPYQEATSSGATSVTFKNAVLSLEITPQITPNNKIILNVKANEDTQGPPLTTGTSPTTGQSVIPIINTQSVESNVLLNDQETIVLGGVYRVNKANTMDRIPFFGSLPVVGFLFRNTSVHDERHELLIFITPRIINSLSKTKNVVYKEHTEYFPTRVYKE